jgi:hypothetical protein
MLPPQKWIPCLAAAGTAVWILRRPQPDRWPAAAVLALLGYASVRVARVAPLFIASAAILLAPAFAAHWPRRRLASLGASRSDRITALALSFAAFAAAAWMNAKVLPCVTIAGPGMPEPAPVRLLANAPSGRVATFFDWGEYAIWHLGPRLRVSMDGRRETVYSDRRLAEHDAILFGTPDGMRTLSEWRPEYVWLPASSTATKAWLAQHDYRIELDAARSFVAVRADLPHLASPPADTGVAACFPG